MAVLCRLSGSPSTSKAALPQASPMVRGNMTRHAIGHNGIACRPMSPFGGSRVQRAAKPRTASKIVPHAGVGDLFKSITGQGATVSLKAEDSPSVSEPFELIVQAEAKTDIKYNKVYLKVRCIERLDVYPLSYNNIDERVTDNVVVWDTELQVAPNGKLCNGESCRWQVQVALPRKSKPSFQGVYIKNLWEFEAALGTGLAGGLNPSSGWVELQVSQ